jgi:hypothetical protein
MPEAPLAPRVVGVSLKFEGRAAISEESKGFFLKALELLLPLACKISIDNHQYQKPHNCLDVYIHSGRLVKMRRAG